MSTISTRPLDGQDTLVASWEALARQSPGARLAVTPRTLAAVFPAWAPLNNAILMDRATAQNAAAAAQELSALYRLAGVDAWALWVPASAASLDASDEVADIRGMRRDTTTLVMRLTISEPSPERAGVVRTSFAAAARAGDQPVPAVDLPEPDDDGGMDAWVMVQDGLAVAGAWSLLEGTDCGIYAVATVPQWRRRGLARGLMRSIIDDALGRGARTATLQSTPMGVPLYESLGFEAVGRYEEWVPA